MIDAALTQDLTLTCGLLAATLLALIYVTISAYHLRISFREERSLRLRETRRCDDLDAARHAAETALIQAITTLRSHDPSAAKRLSETYATRISSATSRPDAIH